MKLKYSFLLSLISITLIIPFTLAIAYELPKIDWSGELRLRFEAQENYDFSDEIHDSGSIFLQRLQLGMNVEPQDNLEIFIQFQDSRVWGEEWSTTSSEEKIDLHQGYLVLGPFEHCPLALKAGRFELSYGDERLVGAFGWNNVGRAFDGAVLKYTSYYLDADFFATKLVEKGIYVSDEDIDFAGFYFMLFPQWPTLDIDLYSLYYRDGAARAGEILNEDPQNTEIYTLGGRANALLYDKTLKLTGEAAYQGGDNGPDDKSAWAYEVLFQYTSPIPYHPFLLLEYAAASGDEDPTDGDNEEFFNLFPTNHYKYGYMDYFCWCNIQDIRVGVGASPLPELTLSMDYHHFSLSDKNSPWRNAGYNIMGWDPEGRSGDSVGSEFDTKLAYKFLEHAVLELGYSYFDPDTFANKVRGEDASNWGYLQLTVTF